MPKPSNFACQSSNFGCRVSGEGVRAHQSARSKFWGIPPRSSNSGYLILDFEYQISVNFPQSLRFGGYELAGAKFRDVRRGFRPILEV